MFRRSKITAAGDHSNRQMRSIAGSVGQMLPSMRGWDMGPTTVRTWHARAYLVASPAWTLVQSSAEWWDSSCGKRFAFGCGLLRLMVAT